MSRLQYTNRFVVLFLFLLLSIVSTCYIAVDAFVVVEQHETIHRRSMMTSQLHSHDPVKSIEGSIDESTGDGNYKKMNMIQSSNQKKSRWNVSNAVGLALSLCTLIGPLNYPMLSTTIANAADSKVVGSFSGSGLFFKDTLQVEAFEDPKVQGVKLYVSNFILPLNERLSSAKNLFSDPSSASLTCAKTGPIKIADTIVKGTGGEQVFEESKSLLFKSLKVQRVYDEENQTLIYVSYNTRLDKNDDSNKSRFKSSLCAIGLE